MKYVGKKDGSLGLLLNLALKDIAPNGNGFEETQ